MVPPGTDLAGSAQLPAKTCEKLAWHARRPAGRGAHPHPFGQDLGEERTVDRAVDLGAPHAADAGERLGTRRDRHGIAEQRGAVIGHVVLADHPAATLGERPFAPEAERLDVVGRHLLDPVEVDGVVHVAELVELVLADRPGRAEVPRVDACHGR